MRTRLSILTLMAGTTLLHGQAMIEYGVSAGRAGAAGAGVGKSVVNAIGRLDKTLAGAANQGSDNATVPAPKPTAPVVAAAVAPVTRTAAAPVDAAKFSEITPGMDKAEMLKLVGKPYMMMSSFEKSAFVETCWYHAGEDNFKIVLRNGKVATVAGLETLAAQ